MHRPSIPLRRLGLHTEACFRLVLVHNIARLSCLLSSSSGCGWSIHKAGMANHQEKPTTSPPPQPAEGSVARPRLPGVGNAHPGSAGYPNPPDAAIPDAATLRDQWRFAVRQYSRWYSHAWGTAILAGAAFFALGWLVKGSNPLPSRAEPQHGAIGKSVAKEDN